MGLRILCTGDVHLGRRPRRIPDGIDARALGPSAVWESFVRAAIDGKVDAVALTGDVVDESNRFYEAYSILQSGVRSLVDAGVAVLAVAGNHDYEVLARLAGHIPEFRLLGRGGHWEQFVLQRPGMPPVRFQGWSFPARLVSRNPLADYTPPTDDLPTLGLLHCDCDASASSYAPVALAELKAKSPTAWLLGHIHKPAILSADLPLVLYPGSPQGLDPSEQGTHGAWLVTIEAGRPPTAECLPLAALRWEAIDLPLEKVTEEDALMSAVMTAMRERHEQIRGEMDHTKAVGCRLALRGRTAIHRRLPGLIDQMRDELRPPLDGVEYFIEKVTDLSRPEAALREIAGANDPAGLLAMRLIALDRREPSADCRELILRARRCIEDARAKAVFSSLPDSTEDPTEQQLRELLVKAGLAVLDNLLAQKEAVE